MLRTQNPFRSAVLLVLVLIALQTSAYSDAKNTLAFPFTPGEKLNYNVYWAGIKAAEATLEILPMTDLEGTQAWHFVMTAQTTSLAAVIYPVHDRIDSWATADMAHALRYTEIKQKRFTTKNISIIFDWQAHTAHSVKNKKTRTVALKPGAFDPLSIFYFFRTQKLREGLTLSRHVADRKRCVQGIAHVRGRQTVHSGGQQWDTWLVEPDLSQVQNVFEKNPDASVQIWVTADEQRLPVKFKSKIAVGSFTAELVGITPPLAVLPGQTIATEDNQTR